MLITAIIPLLFAACEKEPYADFYASRTLVETDEIVHFTNTSYNADYYEWDFGDGTFSVVNNPSHHYTDAGTYTVTLSAFKGARMVDRAYITVEVLFPTILEITVLEYYDEYPVPDASVILYGSLYNWEYEINYISEGFTDLNGVVSFTGVSPVSYWIDVWQENHNNYLLAEDSEDWIKTLPLIRNNINTFIAYVDYFESNTKSTSGKRDKKSANYNYKTAEQERTLKDKPLQGSSAIK